MGVERHLEYRQLKRIFGLTRGCRVSACGYARHALETAVFLGLLVAAGTASQADEAPQEPGAETVEIIVTEDDCRTITRYRDTGAADYKPGVDAYGRPVAGANVSANQASVVPEEIVFTLTVRLAEFVPGLAGSLADTSAPIGEVSVRGREVLLNGEPLNPSQSNAVLVACRERLDGVDE